MLRPGRGVADRRAHTPAQPDRDPCLPCWIVAGACGVAFVVWVVGVLA